MRITRTNALAMAIATFPLISMAKGNKTEDSTASSGTLTISGYTDSYYFKNLNNPLSGNNAGNSGFERIFDQKEGQFQLGLAQTKFTYTTDKSEVVLDLTFGPNADMGNYGNFISLNASGQATNASTAMSIKQAYWTYKATEKLSFTAGQFGTHIGYEVIDAPVNYNYSLSNLFGNGPFYHIGAKANYAFSDKFGIMGGVVNGWDAIYDNNKYRSGVAQVFVSPIENFNIYLNWIGGHDDTPANFNTNIDRKINSFRQLFDITTGYQITDKFYVGLNAAYGMLSKQLDENGEPNKTKTWGGAAFYTNYKINDIFGIGARIEKFDNTQGALYLINKKAGVGTDVTSITITPNITLDGSKLILKPEFRLDMAAKKVEGDDLQQYEDKDGKFSQTTQSTIGMAAIFMF